MDTDTVTFFEKWGYVRVPGAFCREASLQMQSWIWERLQTVHGMERSDPVTWDVPWPGTHITKKSCGLSPAKMATSAFTDVADSLLGLEKWSLPTAWGGALISFPCSSPEPWTVAANGWHWDTELVTHRDSPQGLFTFVVFSDLEPQGGGTLLLAGSHNLLNRFYDGMTADERGAKMKPTRDAFHRSSPYLAALTGKMASESDRIGRFMGPTEDDNDIAVQVVEITGQPGDAYLCHPALLHAVSANHRKTPRLMRITNATRRSTAI